MNIKDVWNFLGLTQDRIGRRRFLIAFFSAQWGLPLVAVLLTGLFYLVFGEDSPILFLPVIVFFTSLIFGFIVYIKICIRRVRDVGITQGWWVLAIIPLINIPFFLYLVLKKGKTIDNDHTSNTSKTEGGLSKSSRVKVAIIAGVLVLGAVSLFAIGIMQPKEDRADISNTQSDAQEVSSVEDLSSLLFEDDTNEDSKISLREMIADVLTRMDDLRYIEDIKYFENQKKIVFYLHQDFLNDPHVESIISALASSVIGDLAQTREGSLSMFIDNEPETGFVYGWSYYQIYLEATRPEDYCYGVNYDQDCGTGKNELGLPVYRTHPILEDVPQKPSNLEVLQIFVDNHLLASFVSGAVFSELNRLNLVGTAYNNGVVAEAPKLSQ